MNSTNQTNPLGGDFVRYRNIRTKRDRTARVAHRVGDKLYLDNGQIVYVSDLPL